MEQDQPKQQKEEKYPKSDLNTNKDKRLRKGSQVNSKANVLQRSKKFFHRHQLLLDLLCKMFWQLKILFPRSEITTTPKNVQVMPTKHFFQSIIVFLLTFSNK